MYSAYSLTPKTRKNTVSEADWIQCLRQADTDASVLGLPSIFNCK